MIFPATYNQEFYANSEKQRDEWISHIRETTNIRNFDDYYDLREEIGKGKYGTVYRVRNFSIN